MYLSNLLLPLVGKVSQLIPFVIVPTAELPCSSAALWTCAIVSVQFSSVELPFFASARRGKTRRRAFSFLLRRCLLCPLVAASQPSHRSLCIVTVRRIPLFCSLPFSVLPSFACVLSSPTLSLPFPFLSSPFLFLFRSPSLS
jgi:hypothetical protein